MNNVENFAAVITLFNPDEKIINRIESILPFVAQIYIVDNSNSPNDKLKNHFQDQKKVEYIFNGDNIGIAAAMNIGIKKALDQNFVYLLTLDQDSEFESKSFENLISAIKPDQKIAIYSPFHKNKYFTNPPETDDIQEVSDIMTSGNILSLDAVKKVGYFKEEYFIDYVDIEYCLRLRKFGYKIMRVNNSFLIHSEANLSRRKILGFVVYPPNHKPFRWYYKIRNYCYLKKDYHMDFADYFIAESRNIRNNIIKILLFENEKYKKLKYAFRGYLDFRKNIKGRMN